MFRIVSGLSADELDLRMLAHVEQTLTVSPHAISFSIYTWTFKTMMSKAKYYQMRIYDDEQTWFDYLTSLPSP